jgi:hypothetical protein
MGNLPASERYTYESNGTYEIRDNYIYFGWAQTFGYNMEKMR